jgi:hypothetical protein
MSTVDLNAHEGARTQGSLSAGRGSRTRRIVARLSLLAMPLVAVYALLVVFESLTTSFRGRPLDVVMYYSAAAALRVNPAADIYNPAVLAQSVHAHAGCALWTGANYLYPPLLAILFEPLTALPCDQAIHDWMLGNLVLWVLCTLLLVYWLRVLLPPEVPDTPPLRTRLLLWLRGEPDTALLATMGVVALSVLAWPVLQGLLMGQVNLLLLSVLLVVPLLVRRKWFFAAGLLLAFAAMLKLLPALLLVYYMMRGRWRVVLGGVIGTALLSGVILLAVRSPVLLGARAIFDSGSYLQVWSDNEALAHAPLWVAVELGAPVGAPLAVLAGRVLLGLVALLFGAGLVLVWRMERPYPSERQSMRNAGPYLLAAVRLRSRAPVRQCREDVILQPTTSTVPRAPDAETIELLGYGWALCAMLLLSPLDWLHYNTWLLLPYLLCAAYLLGAQHRGHSMVQAGALLLVAGVLLFLPWSLQLDGPTYAAAPYLAGVPLRPLLMLLHPAAVVLLWCIAGWVYLRGAGVSRRSYRPSSMPIA